VIDEIFRGTNTTERVAASRGVLAYLNRGDDLVFVATHDIELIELLGTRYDSYHFRELISGDELRFDYLIQSGPTTTRNAIALLELMRFPQEIIDDALRIVNTVQAQKLD
jgi:DNA mismatch repair ATPase MutS